MKILNLALAFIVGFMMLGTDPAFSKKMPRCTPKALHHTIHQIERNFGQVSIIRVYTKGARIAGSGRPSLHASCRAVDFHPRKGSKAQVWKWLKRNYRGGKILYTRRPFHHIHIDIGRGNFTNVK
jgi:uncharacterized protein YcbK (DUF882 family)